VAGKFLNMEILLIAVFILVIFFLVKKDMRVSEKVEVLPYFKISNLLTPAELSFYHVLKIAISDQYDISAKVRLADLISVHKGKTKAEWGKAFNRIKSKHIDFVLCDKQNSEILCAIELDDQSHAKASRIKRDDFVEKALGVARLPLLRFDVTQSYQSQDIFQKIQATIKPEIKVTDENVGVSSVKVQGGPNSVLSGLHETGNKMCPECGIPLVQRESKRGKNAGNIFWGCSNFPQCRYLEAYETENT
jgi:uncharacterized protein DUF2726/topoisomerase-like DNA binding C4 zinc finger protein